MAKRKPINTAESAVKAMVDAALGLPDKPAHAFMRPCDEPFWEGIVRARAREEWTEASLVVAVQLARCQADIESESRALHEEVTVAEKDDLLVVNPRLSVVETLLRREMALMRALRMGGAAAGDVRNETIRRAASRAAAEVRSEIEDDGLLAR